MAADQDTMETLCRPETVDHFVKIISDKVMAVVEQRLTEFMTDFKRQLDSLTSRVSATEARLTQTHTTVHEVGTLANDVNKRLRELERYSRQDNLIFHGLEYGNIAEAASTLDDTEVQFNTGSNATAEQAVTSFIQGKFGLSVNRGDISVAHRLKKRDGARGPAPIIVKFNRKQLRGDILRNRKKLKNQKGFYVNEHLTEYDSQIFARARKLVQENKIFKCWTLNGVTVIKRINSVSCDPVKVFHLRDLD